MFDPQYFTSDNDGQLAKAPSEIETSDDGNVNDVKDMHPLKQSVDIFSSKEGNCIDEKTQWQKIDLLVSCQDFL